MKRILCFLFGHKYNIWGRCWRCGCDQPVDNPIVRSKKELSEFARKMRGK